MKPRLLQQATNLQEAHNDNQHTPAFADGYWVMFDYNRGYADDLEASGLMSIYRQPKYSYYLFQSQRPASEQSALYASGPMVFIASDWTGEGVVAGQTAKVRVVQQCRTSSAVFKWQAYRNPLCHPPARQKLDVRSHRKATCGVQPAGLCAGHPRSQSLNQRQSRRDPSGPHPGPAAAIQIQLDNTGPAPAAFDEVFVKAQLVDSKGNPLRSSGVTLNFHSNELDIVNPQPVVTERGVGVVLVKTGAAGLKGRLTVTAAGLPAASIAF